MSKLTRGEVLFEVLIGVLVGAILGVIWGFCVRVF